LGDERFNDARVDASGRLWIGSMDRALQRPIGALYELEANGDLRCADRGFALSNGIGFSPDARTLYFAETHERVVWRYRVDPVSRSLSERHRFARWSADVGAPDGLTVDAQGGVWVALFGGARIERLSPEGSLDLTLELPVSQPTSCTFGGPNLQTLYVTTASIGLSDTQLASQPLAGATLAIDTVFAGLPEHRLRAVPAALTSPETIR
jgi:sugar lactone lactonase YvrE